MNTKFIFLTISALLMASCNTADDVEVLEAAHQSKVKMKTAASTDFKVSEQLLHKYLNLKKEKPSQISPIVIEGDTLAYKLDYEKGWKLISGDQRLSPVIAQSKEKMCDLQDFNNPEAASIAGLLHHVQEARKSGNQEKNHIWDFLSNENKQVNSKKVARKVQARGIGMGMWIPTDTSYASSVDIHPHVITTSWHQGYPYNIYAPLVMDENGDWDNAPVGCAPVAVGQIVYHYRKNNNRGIMIPTAVIGPDISHKNQFIVTNSSSNGWSYLTNSRYVAMFLRDIGNRMNTSYAIDGSSTYVNKMWVVRNDYLLDFDTKTSYDYNTLITYLRQSQPVMVRGEASGQGHRFIIDGYKDEISTLTIKYEWDESHIITEDEYLHCPQDMFEPDPRGETEKYVEIYSDINTYITMNWGWRTSNSTWYLAHEYSSGYEDNDFAGTFYHPQRDYTYSPYWSTYGGTFNSVSHMFYNFREYYPEDNNFIEHNP